MSHSPYPVTSPFGPRPSGDGFHDGVDLGLPVGIRLYAPFAGVFRRRTDSQYGWYWRIEASGIVTRGAHLSRFIAADGARVAPGELVALSGGKQGAPGSGNSSGPHLHFEYESAGQKLDPMKAGRLGSLFHEAEEDDVLTDDDKKWIQRLVVSAANNQANAIVRALLDGSTGNAAYVNPAVEPLKTLVAQYSLKAVKGAIP